MTGPVLNKNRRNNFCGNLNGFECSYCHLDLKQLYTQSRDRSTLPFLLKHMAELGEERDFYQVLGVPRNSPVSRIRTAYLQTMRKYHPDKAGELDYLGHFYEVQKAWEVLKDQKSRTAYDRQLQGSSIFLRLT